MILFFHFSASWLRQRERIFVSCAVTTSQCPWKYYYIQSVAIVIKKELSLVIVQIHYRLLTSHLNISYWSNGLFSSCLKGKERLHRPVCYDGTGGPRCKLRISYNFLQILCYKPSQWRINGRHLKTKWQQAICIAMYFIATGFYKFYKGQICTDPVKTLLS